VGADTEPRSRAKSVASETDRTLTKQVEISVLTKTLAMSGTSLAEGAPKPGDVFAGRYRIETELGHGAFGVVYRAFDEGPLQRKVALKVIRFDKVGSTAQAALARERFVAEARLAGALSHGNLATIHEVGEHEHWVYMTQELAPGRDLARLLAEKNRVPLRQTIAIVRQICDGLAHAHARGIVHRDIKPANIVVHYEDGRAQVKITDFGVAQPPVGENPSREGLVAGTPGYMAPEQFLAGRIDHRADIFAVGCVLYEMLVGRRAFDGDTLSSVAQQTINVVPPAPSRVQDDLPHAMDRIVAKAIAKDVESRYEGLSELAHDLLHYEQYQYLTDAEPGAVEVAESVRTRHCVLFLGLQLPVGGGGGSSSSSTETGEQFISSWLAQDFEGSGRGRSLPRIAQDLELERGRGELVRRLAAAVENPRISPREILRRVARLDLSVIVTTRYDGFLEKELTERGRKIRRILDCRRVPDCSQGDDALMIRLFGTVDDQETLVITEEDMWRFFNDFHLLADSLKSVFATHELLFLGYDPEDVAFRQLISAIVQFRASTTAGCFLPVEDVSISAVRWAEQKGLHLIDAEAGAFLSLLEETIVQQRRQDRTDSTRPAAPLPSRPYKFLNYFHEEDEAIFFGRAEETQQLISKIHAYPLNILYAPSGSGKTSLINAGVMPQLRRDGYTPVYVRVFDDPVGEIRAGAIDAVGRGDQPRSADAESPLPDLLNDLADRIDGPIVVFVDQFEEIFIRHSPAVRAAFAESLQACVERSGGRLRFVLSFREDFLARLAEFRDRIPTIFHNEMRLGSLTREMAKQAIIEPAKLLGIDVEEDLVHRLLSDLETEGIEPPQLQIVMDHLYDALPPGGTSITFKSYKALGGTRKILTGYLERVLQQLPAPRRRIGREILKMLVTSEETKVISRLADLMRNVECSEDEALDILSEFSDHRLIRRVQTEDGHWYELMHEYLVEEISRWLSAADKELKRVRELLEQAVRNYRNLHMLMPGGQIELVRTHEHDLNLAREERQLLRTSELALTTRRRKMTVLTAAAVVFLAVAGVSWRYAYLSTHVFIESTDRELTRYSYNGLRTRRLETINVYTGSPARSWLDRRLGFPRLIHETRVGLGQLEPRMRDAVKAGEVFAAGADLEQALFERLKPVEQVKHLVTTGRLEDAAALTLTLYEDRSVQPSHLDQMAELLVLSGPQDEEFVDKAFVHAIRPRGWNQALAVLLSRMDENEQQRRLAVLLKLRHGPRRAMQLPRFFTTELPVATLRTFLDSNETRRGAFEALIDLGDCSDLEHVWEMMDDWRITGSYDFAILLRYISECDGPEALGRLEAIGAQPGFDEDQVMRIMRTMYAIGGRSGLPGMQRLAAIHPQMNLVGGFSGVYEPETESILRSYLESESPEVRDAASAALARRGDDSGAQEALLNFHQRRIGTSYAWGYAEDFDLGWGAVSAMRGPQIRRVILTMLADPDVQLNKRTKLLGLLWCYDNPDVLDALMAALTDEDYYLRSAAITALTRNRSRRVQDRLREFATRDDPMGTLSAYVVLSRIDDEDRSAWFRGFLENPPEGVVNDLGALELAGGALSHAFLRLPISAAVEALESTSHVVRAVAIRAVAGHEERPSALERLEHIAEHGEPATRIAAQQAVWAVGMAEVDLEVIRTARRTFERGDVKAARHLLQTSKWCHGAISIGLPAAVVGYAVPRQRESWERWILWAELHLADGKPRDAANALKSIATYDTRHRLAEVWDDPRFQALQHYYDYKVAMHLEKPLLVKGLDVSWLDEPAGEIEPDKPAPSSPVARGQ